jgi:hypothetical protein
METDESWVNSRQGKETHLFFKASSLWGLINFLFNAHRILPEVKAYGVDAHCLVPRLRMGGATPPPCCTPSWRAQGQLDLNPHVWLKLNKFSQDDGSFNICTFNTKHFRCAVESYTQRSTSRNKDYTVSTLIRCIN